MSKNIYEEFLTINNTNKKGAEKLFTFVCEYCANNKMWDICRVYLGNGHKQHQRALEKFVHMVKFAKEHEGETGDLIYKNAVESIKKEFLWILNTLYHKNTFKYFETTIKKIEIDLKERKFEEIYTQILEKSPNKSIRL